MNKVILMGRLTRDPEVRYSSGENSRAVARYTLAVNRKFKRDGEASADFLNCVVFGKPAEFAEKYFRKGLQIVVSGRIQTGSYTNKDGQKVYTTDIIIEEQDFAESRNSGTSQGGNNNAPESGTSQGGNNNAYESNADTGFMNVPEGLDDLPFN